MITVGIVNFVNRLRESPHKWQLVTDYYNGKPLPPAIRTDNGVYNPLQCPIAAQIGPGRSNAGFTADELKQIGITQEECVQVMNAADNYQRQDPILRAMLLDACGLTETQQAEAT